MSRESEREAMRKVHAPSSKHYRKGHREHCTVIQQWAEAKKKARAKKT